MQTFANQLQRLAVATVLLLCLGSANAGLFEDEEARKAILDLRQQNAELRQRLDALKGDSDQKVARSADEGVQLRRSFIELQNQLETLRADLAKLRGEDEQMARDVAELQRRQKDLVQSLDDRLRKLEPSKVVVDGKEFLADPAEKRAYEAAWAIFRKGEFANAQLAFVDFLNRHPQSGYRPSALFWLGNSQYATKDYKEALANFRILVSSHSDHIRVPEAVLAIANCQLEMKESKAAKKTLEELIASYPTSEAAAAAKERLARLK